MDDKLGILSERQRRLILLTLKDDAEKTESDMLFRSGEIDDAELQLVHNHLPRLEEAGYIEWDRDGGTISKGPRYAEIKPLLDLMENHADELPPDWP